MEVVFLGTSAGGPQAGRSATAVALRLAGHSQGSSHMWLFDCGEGTYRQLVRSSLSHSQVERVFVSHMHGDHIWGLASMLVSALNGDAASPTISVYGPRGLHAYLSAVLELSEVGLRRAQKVVVYELHDREVQPKTRWEKAASSSSTKTTVERVVLLEEDDGLGKNSGTWLAYEDEWWSVRAGRVAHRVPCYGYVVAEKPALRKVDAAKATALGVAPGRAYRQFQLGQDVTKNDGTVVRAADVTFDPSPGRKVAVLGDTSAPSPEMSRLAQRCDLLVHEATASDADRHKALARGHSTPTMAGRFANHIAARHLALTHFSPRYVQHTSYSSDQNDKASVNLLVSQAKRAFAGGNVIAASDFMAINVPRASSAAASSEEEVSSSSSSSSFADDAASQEEEEEVSSSSERRRQKGDSAQA